MCKPLWDGLFCDVRGGGVGVQKLMSQMTLIFPKIVWTSPLITESLRILRSWSLIWSSATMADGKPEVLIPLEDQGSVNLTS